MYARGETSRHIRTRLFLATVPVLAGAAVALLVLWPGDESAPADDPGTFIAGLVREISDNDYDDAWESLHPAHQRVAGRAAYVDCESRTPVPGELESVTVLRVADAQVHVAGQAERVAGKAVRVRLAFSDGLYEPDVVVHTGHAVAVAGRWAWILPQERFDAYRAGRCPGS